MQEKKLKKHLFDLLKVMHSITSEHNLEKLLRLIVNSAIDITGSDAASLYLRHGEKLKFVVTSNKTMEKRMGKEAFEATIKQFFVPISKESIAGFVAFTGEPLNITDVYQITGKPYSYNKQFFDEKYDYRNMSMLTVPLLNRSDEVIGVLQLMNKLDEDGEITKFVKYDEDIARSLGAEAAISIENVRLTEAVKKAHYDTIMLLSETNEFRDNETGYHVKRVSLYCELLAHTLGMDEGYIEFIKFASPLHDIGKIGIPDHILKKPGQLTFEEYEIMKTHASIGQQLLSKTDFPLMQIAQEIAGSHHEKWDGSGYPRGLKGEDIPLCGRITAIADVFDALSNKRVYKPAFPLDETFDIISKDAGTHFDPNLVEKFFSVKDEVMLIYEAHQEMD